MKKITVKNNIVDLASDDDNNNNNVNDDNLNRNRNMNNDINDSIEIVENFSEKNDTKTKRRAMMNINKNNMNSNSIINNNNDDDAIEDVELVKNEDKKSRKDLVDIISSASSASNKNGIGNKKRSTRSKPLSSSSTSSSYSSSYSSFSGFNNFQNDMNINNQAPNRLLYNDDIDLQQAQKRQKNSLNSNTQLRKEQDEEFEIAQAVDKSNELYEKELAKKLENKKKQKEEEEKAIIESEERMLTMLKESLLPEPENDKDSILIIIRLPSAKLKRKFPLKEAMVKHIFSFIELNEPKCRASNYSLRIPPILSSSISRAVSGEEEAPLTVMDSATLLRSNDIEIQNTPLKLIENQLKGSVLQVLFPL